MEAVLVSSAYTLFLGDCSLFLFEVANHVSRVTGKEQDVFHILTGFLLLLFSDLAPVCQAHFSFSRETMMTEQL